MAVGHGSTLSRRSYIRGPLTEHVRGVLLYSGLLRTRRRAIRQEGAGHLHHGGATSLAVSLRPKAVEGPRLQPLWSVNSGEAVLLVCRLTAIARSPYCRVVTKVSLASQVGPAYEGH